jgi:rhodanese-related sulfurtransferase
LCGRLVALLKGSGFRNVLEYVDGISGWRAAGYPLAQATVA